MRVLHSAMYFGDGAVRPNATAGVAERLAAVHPGGAAAAPRQPE